MIRYNIDDVLNESRPIIVFRGREYAVRDLTVKETISNIRSAKTKEEKIRVSQKNRIRKEIVAEGVLTEKEDIEKEVDERLNAISLEDSFADYLPVAVEVVTSALEGFPKDLAESLTVKEFKALQSALEAANSKAVVVEEEKGSTKKK